MSEALTWHSPYETPESKCHARRVLVWVMPKDNPPAMNAPGRMAFGHRVVHPEQPPHWPANGWFYDGQSDYEKVVCWAYADPPSEREVAGYFGRTICKGCKAEVDPDICHCGDSIESHTFGSGHSPVPMGCQCGYVKKDEFDPAKPFGGDGSVPF